MKYTAIYDVSNAIAELIRANVTPAIIGKPEDVGLCSPANHGDFTLGIYLYSIEESENIRLSGRRNEGLYTQRYPPAVLDLFYMITAFFKTDVKFLAEQEQTLFGKIIQTVNDNSRIFADSAEPVTLELFTPNTEDRYNIRTPDEPYRTSLFLAARTVIIESARTVSVPRVTDITIRTGTK